MNTKQIIVARKDLKMNPGKLAAQCSHASVKAIMDTFNILENRVIFKSNISETMYDWLINSYAKVVLRVDSEKELLTLYEEIKDKVPCALILDEGRTVFKEPTYTCLGIGPEECSILDEFTKHLKLY